MITASRGDFSFTLGGCRSIRLPVTPVTVIVEIVLSGAGLKDSVSGYGPGKFVFEGAHYENS